jgi:hypothetical protein
MSHNSAFYGLKLQFAALPDWLGNTTNQEQIIQQYRSGNNVLDSVDLLNEFIVTVGDEGVLSVGYSPTAYHSAPELRAGIKFPPALLFAFKSHKETSQAIQLFTELRSFFQVVIGDDLDIEGIELFYDGLGPFNQKAFLFYSCGRYSSRSRHSLVFYPLSRNLRFDTLGLPEFPIEAFDKYFRLNKRERSYFIKYVRYRRLQNVEERFLGYFRLLESVCYKVGRYLDDELLSKLSERSKPILYKYFKDRKAVNSFLKRLPKYNNSKYNTEKCIGDFLKSVPLSLSSSWAYQKQDLAKICKLRNDISHANHYEVTDEDLESMAKYCEVLLVISLLLKLGISLDSAIAVIDRMEGYFLLKKAIDNQERNHWGQPLKVDF